MKTLLRHIATVFGYGLLLGILSPILDFNDVMAVYNDPIHWIICFSSSVIVYTIVTIVHNRKK